MNDDQLYYFLVDKNTRNVLQIDYPSDIDEFNKILGTSEGKGKLLKELGIILSSDVKVFENPKSSPKKKKIIKNESNNKTANTPTKITTANKRKKSTISNNIVQGNLFADLFE